MTNCEIVIVATDEQATDIQIPFNVITSTATVSATGATTTTHHLAPLQQHTEQQQLLQADTLQQQVQAGTLPPHLDRPPTAGPEKPFQCNICERRFRQLSTLTNHIKIHTGEKPYKCTICDKTFRQSSTLTNHIKIHTGQKPFICSFCPKQFRQLSTLTNHLKIHTGEKPFECAVCKKQFRQSSTLNNHIKIHVMDKVYIPVKIKTEEDEGWLDMVTDGQSSVTTNSNHQTQLQQLPLQLQQQTHQVVLDATQLAEDVIPAADVVKIEANSVQSDCEYQGEG